MKKLVILALIFCLTLPLAHASWQDYSGETTWNVKVIEDESDCGGGTSTESYSVSLLHDFENIIVGDLGHGQMSGTISENTLSVETKTIQDGIGKSTLYAFNVEFTCESFSTKYEWYYVDSYMSCTGTTEWQGTRTDDGECPEKAAAEETGVAPEEETLAVVESNREKEYYQEILKKDPTNFWANWDMAELEKEEGRYQDAFNYIEKAANNENIYKETRLQLQKQALKDLHLSDPPTTENSLLLKQMKEKEIEGWSGGRIYNMDVPKEEKKETLPMKIWALFTPDTDSIITELVTQ